MAGIAERTSEEYDCAVANIWQIVGNDMLRVGSHIVDAVMQMLVHRSPEAVFQELGSVRRQSPWSIEMNTETVKTKPFNPVDHMTTDEEVIEFLMDCHEDDPEGRVFERACKFVKDSRGTLKAHDLIGLAGKAIVDRLR